MEEDSKIAPTAVRTRESSVGWMLKRLSVALDAQMSNELKRLDLNLSQFAVLMTLLEAEGLTQTEIGRKIAMPGYSTTRTLDALEEKQYVERCTDERSRRSHRIYLTEQGRGFAPELFGIVRNVNEQLLSVLSTAESRQLATLLKKLVLAKFE